MNTKANNVKTMTPNEKRLWRSDQLRLLITRMNKERHSNANLHS